MYNFKEIEDKWQKKWENDPYFKAVDFDKKREKFYVLYEFPNVSGKSLHMGHLKGSVPADVLARYKRFKGFNVLFPIGGDAFGLPAENSAIKFGINPKEFVKNGFEVILNQLKGLGISFDFDRSFCTSDPEYYKWTQWIFLKLFENGKAYKQKGTVNYCEHCQTVLSNEDSQGGKCDRCGNDVVQVNRDVWFLKMKEYAEKLLGNVDRIDMAQYLKESQRNWIGKSEGVQAKFEIVDEKKNHIGEIEIFTTCIETIYGVTFLSIAPENELVEKLSSHIKNLDEVRDYQRKTALRSEFDRKSNVKEKTGCVLDGIFAVNPVNGNLVKIYLADFVLNGYGTGAVMAVPTHDQRDFEFAKKFNIPMIQVIEGDTTKCAVEKTEYLEKNSKMMNSGEFSGMNVKDAKSKMADMIEENGWGKKVVTYSLKDWPFNRQRYWGEPFPVVFCDKCGIVPLEEKDLPLVLPETNDYMPNKNGDSPLSKIDSFVNCKCPKCGGNAKRETDTMPNWAGSSWYWLRFCDPKNDKALADFDKLKYWGSVDVYTGGTEHITRHVLYAFFWQNFLYDIGVVPTRDPFKRKMGSGLVLDSEGKKMSKSSINGVSPQEVIDKYGVDVARLHLHFLAGYEDNCLWTYNGVDGIVNFLDRVWNLKDIVVEPNSEYVGEVNEEGVSLKHNVEINNLIKKVENDFENLKLNTAIASFMTFIKMVREDKFITKEELRRFLIALNPLAPHLTSEVFEIVFGKNIITESWPKVDESAQYDKIELPVQVNGKIKATILVKKDASKDDVLKEICEKQIGGGVFDFENAKKVIYVPGRIINFVL